MKLNEYKLLCEVIAVKLNVVGAENPVLNHNRIKKEHTILKDKVTLLKQQLAQLEREYLDKFPEDIKEKDKTIEYHKYVGACSSIVIATKLVNEIFD